MIIDGHWDTILHYHKQTNLNQNSAAHVDWQRFKQVADIGFSAIYLDRDKYNIRIAWEQFNYLVNCLNRDLSVTVNLNLLLNSSQLKQVPPRKFLLLGAEGAHFLGHKDILSRLEQAFNKGLRLLGLTWNYNTCLAGGCLDGGGITALGKQAIAFANQNGLILDGAHLSAQSLSEMIELSEQPIIVSHTGCTALAPQYGRRNLDDQQLKMLAQAGGVAGIYFVPNFLGGTPSLERIVEHIEHAVTVAGIDHVAIGSDFDGTELPPDIKGIEDLPLLLQKLRQRGFNDEDIAKIAGQNWLRILHQVLPKQ